MHTLAEGRDQGQERYSRSHYSDSVSVSADVAEEMMGELNFICNRVKLVLHNTD